MTVYDCWNQAYSKSRAHTSATRTAITIYEICLELFDPYLLERLMEYGHQGKVNPSYLSANMYNELINITVRQVINKIKYSILRVNVYHNLSI